MEDFQVNITNLSNINPGTTPALQDTVATRNITSLIVNPFKPLFKANSRDPQYWTILIEWSGLCLHLWGANQCKRFDGWSRPIIGQFCHAYDFFSNTTWQPVSFCVVPVTGPNKQSWIDSSARELCCLRKSFDSVANWFHAAHICRIPAHPTPESLEVWAWYGPCLWEAYGKGSHYRGVPKSPNKLGHFGPSPKIQSD